MGSQRVRHDWVSRHTQTGYSSKEGSIGILICFQLAAADAHNPGQSASTLTPGCLGFSIFKKQITCFSIDISLLPFTFTRASKIFFNYFNLGWLCKKKNRPLSQRTFNKLSLFLRKYKIWNIFHKVLHKIIFLISELFHAALWSMGLMHLLSWANLFSLANDSFFILRLTAAM